MKYEINLLPTQALVERQDNLKKRRERSLFFAALVACCIVLLSYGAIWWGLRSLQVSVADQIVSQNKDRTAITEQITQVNGEVGELNSRIASYTLWTSHIPDVLLAVPQGVLISRMELVEDQETLVITGTASHGSEAVAYQSALEKLPWVERVVAPLQNFARAPQATITFTIFHKKPFIL